MYCFNKKLTIKNKFFFDDFFLCLLTPINSSIFFIAASIINVYPISNILIIVSKELNF